MSQGHGLQWDIDLNRTVLSCSLFTHSDIASTPRTSVLYNEAMKMDGTLSPLPNALALSAVFILSYWPLLPMAAHSILVSGGGAGPGGGLELCMTWHFTGYLHTSNGAFCVRRAAHAGQKSPKLTGTWAKLPVCDFRVEWKPEQIDLLLGENQVPSSPASFSVPPLSPCLLCLCRQKPPGSGGCLGVRV